MTDGHWDHASLIAYPRIAYAILDDEAVAAAIDSAIDELARRNPRLTFSFSGKDVVLVHWPDGWTTAALALRMPLAVVRGLDPTSEHFTIMASILMTARTAMRQSVDIGLPHEPMQNDLRLIGTRLTKLVAERMGVDRETVKERILLRTGTHASIVAASPFGDAAVEINGRRIPLHEVFTTGTRCLPAWRIEQGNDGAHHSLVVGPLHAYIWSDVDDAPIETMRLAARPGVADVVDAVIAQIEEGRLAEMTK